LVFKIHILPFLKIRLAVKNRNKTLVLGVRLKLISYRSDFKAIDMIKKIFLNDQFILALILINAGLIFIGGFQLNSSEMRLISFADDFISVLFLFELTIKINAYGKKFFEKLWNNFDFILIVISLPALISDIFQITTTDFSFLLVLRVLRVFKSFRFLKFIPGVDKLISGIKRAIKASVIVILGFAVYIFIVGIFSFYLFKESAPDYFSNPLSALYSTFKIFTVEGWYEIPEKITEDYSKAASFFTYIYFVFVVLSGGIFGLSLVNSIFVDAMVSDNNDELEEKIRVIDSKLDLLLNREYLSKKDISFDKIEIKIKQGDQPVTDKD
jgi:voltage-gated sodium channel